MDVKIKEYMEVTCRYYSKWLGKEGLLLNDFDGIQYVYSDQRNIAQYGYGKPFDIYVLCRDNRTVISYGNTAVNRLEAMKNAIGSTMSVKEIGQTLERIFHCKASYNIKYVFKTMPVAASEARVLTGEDYREYEAFFLKCHASQNIGWLRGYFEEMVQERMCIGIFADGELVSCTDAPGMPYMTEDVQEIGVNTLYEYRGRGYAASACSRCIQEIRNNNKVPMWSTSIDNIASRKLAEKIGFEVFARVIHIML